MPTVPINWLAVIVAAVAAWLIGALWYSVLFGTRWVAAHGFTPDRIAVMKKGAARAYGGSFLGFLAIALTLAVLVGYLGMSSWLQGLKLGLLIWAGLALPLGLIGHLYSDRRFETFAIDAGYQLVYFVVMGAIIGGWR